MLSTTSALVRGVSATPVAAPAAFLALTSLRLNWVAQRDENATGAQGKPAQPLGQGTKRRALGDIGNTVGSRASSRPRLGSQQDSQGSSEGSQDAIGDLGPLSPTQSMSEAEALVTNISGLDESTAEVSAVRQFFPRLSRGQGPLCPSELTSSARCSGPFAIHGRVWLAG